MRIGLALLVAAALGSLLWALLATGTGPDSGTLVREAPVEEADPEDRVAPAGLDGATDSRPGSSREDAAVAPGEAPLLEEAVNAPDTLAEVRGHFVLAGGAPVAGVTVSLHGWPASGDRVKRHGEPGDWQDPAPVVSDARGAFSIRLDPPRAFQFTLDATFAGYAGKAWRWSEIEPGKVLDLGEVELVQPGTIVVRLVDGECEALAGSWSVRADSESRRNDRGQDAVRASAYLPEGDGSYRLEGLPAGPARLRARSETAFVDGPLVEVVAGEVVEATIVNTGPDASRRILVSASCRPFRFEHGVESVRLIRGSEVIASVAIDEASDRHSFDDLDPGLYSVEIEDPRFEPWSRSGIEPGTRVSARLVGNAAVALAVVDESTGEAIETYTLAARLDDMRSRPNVFDLFEPGEAPPQGGLVEGLLPGNLVLIVAAPGYAEADVAVPELQPLETRALAARLQRGSRIAGRFSLADGVTPVAAGTVQLFPEGQEPRFVRPAGLVSGWKDPDRPEFEHTTETDPNGAFELRDVPPGRYALHGHASAWLVGTIDPLVVPPGEDLVGVDLRAPLAAGLRGRLIAPEGAEFSGLRLCYHPGAEPRINWRFVGMSGKPEVEPDDQGNFELHPLPAGPGTLSLRGADVMLPAGAHGSVSSSGFAITVAELELVTGERLERSFDVRDRWPGSVEVTVLREGVPAPGMVVELLALGPERGGTYGATTDGSGVAVVESVFAGRYTILVHCPGEHWSAVEERAIDLASSERASRTISITLARGTLRVLDADSGEPLAGTWVVVRAIGSNRGMNYKPDDEGRLELELPLGPIEVEIGSRLASEEPTIVEWTASGPVPDEVRLRR